MRISDSARGEKNLALIEQKNIWLLQKSRPLPVVSVSCSVVGNISTVALVVGVGDTVVEVTSDVTLTPPS